MMIIRKKAHRRKKNRAPIAIRRRRAKGAILHRRRLLRVATAKAINKSVDILLAAESAKALRLSPMLALALILEAVDDK